MGSKKSSEQIHREHAEQKRRRDRQRAEAGYRRKSYSAGPSRKEQNALSNPFAQMLAGLIRFNRGKQHAGRRKAQYTPQKRI